MFTTACSSRCPVSCRDPTSASRPTTSAQWVGLRSGAPRARDPVRDRDDGDASDPGSANFVGEFFILTGAFESKEAIARSPPSQSPRRVYALRMYQRTMHNRLRRGRFARDHAAEGPCSSARRCIVALALQPRLITTRGRRAWSGAWRALEQPSGGAAMSLLTLAQHGTDFEAPTSTTRRSRPLSRLPQGS